MLRQRANRIAELHEAADDLRQEQEEREQRAVVDERARIGRELHDIVSHSISVITIQTRAVRRRLGPEQAAEARDLHDVEDAAREAMAEMRRLLGVLRTDGPVALAPQPGLDQLPRLLAETEAAGVRVALCTEGDPDPLPPGLDLTAYRIIQEALTNCRKHSPAPEATVVIRYLPTSLELQVDDDGPVPLPADGKGGHGLIGMRERVLLYGGTLRAGRRPDGGFSVRATLPRRNGAGG